MSRTRVLSDISKYSLLAVVFLAALAGCHSKEKEEQKRIEAERKFVSTPVNWVTDKMDNAGVKLGSSREQLLEFIKQENYRVCVSNAAYVHAVVPNSKIHPGEQDIHIVGAFNQSDGTISNLEVQSPIFSVVDLNADCR
jgi:hypothetical protein